MTLTLKKSSTPILSLLLNVYNEEKNIERTYKECKGVLKKAKIPFEIIIVEGGSSDNSWKILQSLERKNNDCRVFQTRMEPGRKVNKGMKEARGKYFGYMCSDGQENPNIIPKCIKLLEEGKADFVKAKRITRSFWQRFVISRIYNTLCGIFFNLNLYDINMHPKIFRRDFVKNINLISIGESVDLEIVLRAKKCGYRFIEIPVKERDRKDGKSSVTLGVMLNMIRDMFSYKWGEKKRLLLNRK